MTINSSIVSSQAIIFHVEESRDITLRKLLILLDLKMTIKAFNETMSSIDVTF